MSIKLLLGIVISMLLISLIYAQSDISVFQGQYYNETSFIQGTFEFVFDIYDAEVGGNLVGSYETNLTTGTWGQWKVEVPGVSTASNDVTKNYFIEISIDGEVQLPRRRLSHFNYLRKNTDDSTTKSLTINNTLTIRNILKFVLGGSLQELANNFIFSKSLEVSGDINASGSIYSNNKLVCLEDGTNCLAGGGGSFTQYVSFISTVDGKLNKNDRYLALGTDGGVSASSTEMAWIIDRNMIITGILWDAKSNSRTKASAIILMSGSNKNSLSETSLTKDIQGVVSGSDNTFSVSLSQGDAVAIKYDSEGNGGEIIDLSITLIGTYD